MKTPAFQEFRTLNWESIQPLYQQLEDFELTEDSQDSWMEQWSDLRKLVDERYARLELATELDTTDEEAEKQYHDFLDNIYPSIKAADQALKEKILGSELTPRGMELALKKMQVEANLFREENLPLMTEENKLGSQYSKILGAQTIQWKGEELTLVQVKAAILTTDREVRKELWELLSQRGIKCGFSRLQGIPLAAAASPELQPYREPAISKCCQRSGSPGCLTDLRSLSKPIGDRPGSTLGLVGQPIHLQPSCYPGI